MDALIVHGPQSDFCVHSTVRRALALGDRVPPAADAHTTPDNGVPAAARITAPHNATLAHIGGVGPGMAAVPAAEVALEA